MWPKATASRTRQATTTEEAPASEQAVLSEEAAHKIISSDKCNKDKLQIKKKQPASRQATDTEEATSIRRSRAYRKGCA